MEERIYYERDDKKRPIITVCILEDPNGKHYYKGTAVCSPKDAPRKSFGRMLAYGRATKAFVNGDKTAMCPDGFAFKKCCVLKRDQLTHFERKLFTPRT